MSDLRETKSMVAKLMAEENLDVQHGNYQTAMFDLKNRTLLLPVYKWMDGPVYDLMCSHEVGHARYTPEDGWHQAPCDRGKGYRSFINIVEDARIEKKIKRKFPGAGKQMIQGYGKLLQENFFGIHGYDIDTLPLIDKINLHTKLGSALNIQFSEEEREYVRMVEETETFEEVLEAVEALWNYAKSNESETDKHQEYSQMSEEMESNEEPLMTPPEDGDGEENDESNSEESDCDSPVDNCENSETEDEEKEENGSSDSDSESEEEKEKSKETKMSSGLEGGTGHPGDEFEPSSFTDNEWQKRQDDLLENTEDNEKTSYLYLEAAKANLDHFVIDYKRVFKDIEEVTAKNGGSWGYGEEYDEYERSGGSKAGLGWGVTSGPTFDIFNDLWSEFRKKHQKVINYLAKEFEMKKAATQHSRSLTAKTGVIDSGTLFKYRYSEDIFKKMTVVPDGKSHGLLLFIDWSGSMHQNIFETVEQCLVLAAFCEKVQISFEVYAFTDSSSMAFNKDAKDERWEDKIRNAGENVQSIGNFRLLNLLSSRMNKREFQKGAKYFLGLGHSIVYRYSYSREKKWLQTPEGYHLGGTPLDEAILTSLTIVPEFKKRTGAEIVNTVYLTDGESRRCNSRLVRVEKDMSLVSENFYPLKPKEKHYGSGARVFIKCANGKQVDIGSGRTSDYLNLLREATGVNVIGFFLADRKWFKQRGRYQFEWDVMQNMEKEWKKNGSIAMKNDSGYDERYYINTNKMSDVEDANLDNLTAESSKGQIRTAFKKMVGGKLTNRVILNKMIDMIAA